MNEWLQRVSFLAPDWKDAIDIVIVAAIIYRILRMMWGTRAIQMLLGFFSLAAIFVVASVLDLRLIEYLLRTVFQYGIIAALVVFQPELRSALTQLGQNRLFRVFTRLERNEVAEEIAEAAEELSRNRTGAIIAIEREVGLGEYAETGTSLQARVSSPLLQNIFTPYSILHDGAAIIRGDEIIAAGAILPLTQAAVADRSLGTRHRAALGLSDETDALIVVVSEETGVISVAHRGRLRRGVNADELQGLLAGAGDVI